MKSALGGGRAGTPSSERTLSITAQQEGAPPRFSRTLCQLYRSRGSWATQGPQEVLSGAQVVRPRAVRSEEPHPRTASLLLGPGYPESPLTLASPP